MPDGVLTEQSKALLLKFCGHRAEMTFAVPSAALVVPYVLHYERFLLHPELMMQWVYGAQKPIISVIRIPLSAYVTGLLALRWRCQGTAQHAAPGAVCAGVHVNLLGLQVHSSSQGNGAAPAALPLVIHGGKQGCEERREVPAGNNHGKLRGR